MSRFAPSLNIKDDPQCLMTSSEVITFVLISALFYQCNYRLTRLVISRHNYFPFLLSRSRLIRRIHQIPEIVWIVIFTVCKNFLSNKNCQSYIIDSFPVAVCQNYKIFKCKIVKGESYRGYIASKKVYFFGIKVHMLINLDGVPIEFHFTPGSISDVEGLKRFSFDLNDSSQIYADKAYNDYQFEDLLLEAKNIRLVPKRKKNSKRKNSGIDDFYLSIYRNKIESVFSSITSLMPRFIRAKTIKGFCLKVYFYILGYMMKRFSLLT